MLGEGGMRMRGWSAGSPEINFDTGGEVLTRIMRDGGWSGSGSGGGDVGWAWRCGVGVVEVGVRVGSGGGVSTKSEKKTRVQERLGWECWVFVSVFVGNTLAARLLRASVIVTHSVCRSG